MSIDDAKRKVILGIEDELITRIKRGDPIPDIRKWFCTRFCSEDMGELRLADLTPFLQAFAKQLVFQFNEWCRWQEELARKGKLN